MHPQIAMRRDDTIYHRSATLRRLATGQPWNAWRPL